MSEINTLQISSTKNRPNKRTARVIMCDQARVLKELREERGLSMRKLGNLMGKSDSYISQVENGRMDIPIGDGLEHYLAALGGMTAKSFYDRARRFKVDRQHTERDKLLEVAKRATETQVRQILLLAKTILATQMNY